jgi:hypothetical protein
MNMDFEALVEKIRGYLQAETAKAEMTQSGAPMVFVATRPNRTLSLDPAGFALA